MLCGVDGRWRLGFQRAEVYLHLPGAGLPEGQKSFSIFGSPPPPASLGQKVRDGDVESEGAAKEDGEGPPKLGN